MDAIDKVRKGEYVPDRENDELTLALGNPEHVGRLRGYPERCHLEGRVSGVTLTVIEAVGERRRRSLDRLSELERKVQEQQEQTRLN